MKSALRLLILVGGLLAPVVAVAAEDAQGLLTRADKARGGGLPGIVWEIDLVSRSGAKVDEPQKLLVKAVDNASVAETLQPSRFRGSKILQIERNMWLTRAGLSKPIPISPRQRMSGQASNGDIAATNYAADYEGTISGRESVNGEDCHVLELRAKHKRTTYDRVRYWISASREVGVKAEFYSVSGKLIKSALFDYDNTIEYSGQKIPFVSKMTIRDALVDAETVMTFGAITAKKISPTEFDLGQLQ